MNNNAEPESNDRDVWPPAIKHNFIPPPVTPTKHEQGLIKRRWYYAAAVLFFAWRLFQEHSKSKGFVLNMETATTWFGLWVFVYQSFQAWKVYFRTRHDGRYIS